MCPAPNSRDVAACADRHDACSDSHRVGRSRRSALALGEDCLVRRWGQAPRDNAWLRLGLDGELVLHFETKL